MDIGRRDVFKFIGGSAVGMVFTPVPWTLFNDSAKWSQNWSWIPRVRKGEIRTRFTTCSLCPAGCGVKARCVGDQPVSLAGVTAHPVSRGALCPIALAAHHQPYHPLRVLQPQHRGKPLTLDEAAAAVRSAIAARAGKGRMAVFDAAPGRAVSALYKRFAEKAGGLYLACSTEGDTLRSIAAIYGRPPGSFGLDLENARTILSFSTPILDGWGTPGRVLRQRPNFRLIQVEAEASRTASLADNWLAIQPGTEGVLAKALAHVLTNGKQAPDLSPAAVAGRCGVPAARIEETARFLAQQNPPMVIGDGDPCGNHLEPEALAAVANLNVILGSVGVPGGIVPHRLGGAATAPPEQAADGEIGVLIAAGGPIPWSRIEKKLAPGAMVVNLSSWPDAKAEYTIPAPVFLESAHDIPAPADARADSLSLAAQLIPPPAGVIEPADFLAKLEPSIGKAEDALQARLEAIYKTGRGRVTRFEDGKTTPLAEIKSADDFKKVLQAGAIWTDDEVLPLAPAPRRALAALPPTSAGSYGWRAVKGLAVSPILSKLYQESNLRDGREA
jgi:anaerobic selenocysteine-containing dehydrogenase